jgi:serine/threonine protein kinase
LQTRYEGALSRAGAKFDTLALGGRLARIEEDEAIAQRWASAQGPDWRVAAVLGTGATASVFRVESAIGSMAFKLYGQKFSAGETGAIEQKRIDQQKALAGHTCPWLIQVRDGGSFEGRLFVLMEQAPGQELERRLDGVPRDKMRTIVDQVARAVVFLRQHGLCHRDIKSAKFLFPKISSTRRCSIYRSYVRSTTLQA